MPPKVLLGLSGGVDSAVAAYILKQQGYEVTCCFMRNWDSYANNDILGNPLINNELCPQEEDYNDAVRVAEILGLPLRRVDYIAEYWEEVFQNFLDEYQRGRTPNPDILCNKYIKFSHFLNYAIDYGFEMIATGHYAKVEHKNDRSYLLRAKDKSKDQSYFLSQISPFALSKVLFPLGDITKKEVRKIAEELKLPIAKKKDSTGICFIGERNFKVFLKNYIPAKEGPIHDIDSQKIIGEHGGVMYYTIGQRKGLMVGGKGGPYFVIGKDVKKNILYVSGKNENYWLTSDSCVVGSLNWFNETKAEDIKSARFRYRQADTEVEVKDIKKEITVGYPEGARAVTVGQQAVFYCDEYCLGGGVIEKVYKGEEDIEKLIKRYHEN